MVSKVSLGSLLSVLTDYHANGAYKKLKENVELFDKPNYAVMIRTTNFEQECFDSNLKYISEHAYNFLGKSKVYTGDIIMNKIANAGSSYLMPELKRAVSLAMNLFLLRVDEKKANPTFVYLYLKLNEKYVKSFANGSVTKTITKEAVRNLEIELPDRAIQNYIVEVYMAYTDKLTLNHKTNQTLEQMAQVLFKSWFVDFDPVFDNALASGIAVNDFPEALKKKAEQRQQVQQQIVNGEPSADKKAEAKPLPEDIRQLFPSEFEQTDEPSIGINGWIPKGWSLDSFAMVATLKNKSIHPKKEPEKLWAQFSLPAFDNGKMPTLDLGIEIKSGKYKLSENTVLVSKLNPHTPRIWMPKVSDTDVSVCSTEFMPFEPVNNEHRVFVYSLMNSESVKSKIASRVTGTTGSHQRVSPKEVAVMPVLLPSLECITSFSNLIKSSFDKVELNLEQNIELTKLRDTLLPKLISGELQLQE